MGFIKEPEGVDFIINSKTLSDKERQEISLYIKKYKSKEQIDILLMSEDDINNGRLVSEDDLDKADEK
jgi:hypothetical protein